MERKTRVIGAVVVGCLMFVGGARGQVECGTIVEADYSQCCPIKGGCDNASERDLWDHTRLSAPNNNMRIRMRMHVFGTAPVSSIVNDQILELEGHFDALNIDVALTWHRILDPTYYLLEDEADVAAMKAAYANSPETQLNIYVTDIGGTLGFGGRGFYPWASAGPTTSNGGIMIDRDKIDGHRTTLTHEVGHNLGLWHTHHGWNDAELRYHGDGCDPELDGYPCDCCCYEAINASNCDTVGDFCCDTPTTPFNTTCAETTTPNLCDAQAFDSEWTNFMGVAADGATTACRDYFSTQQKSRMLCWACDAVAGWIDGQDCDSNGVVDECDLARGDASDCDQDGLLDDCEPLEKGGCCFNRCSPSASCQPGHTACSCAAAGGAFGGQGSKCSTLDCCTMAQ